MQSQRSYGNRKLCAGIECADRAVVSTGYKKNYQSIGRAAPAGSNQRMKNQYTISLATKTSYGAGSIATGVKDTAFNVFLLFFYTQVAELSGALAGAAIFTALVLDAISDPLVGYWSDRWRSRLGRRHPFIYASAIPMGIAFYFLFHPPFEASQSTLFLWMATWAALTRFFMTFYTVPSTALTADMTSNYDERTSLSSFRVLLGWLGGLVFATVGYVVFFAPNEQFADGRLDPLAYHSFALVGAVAIVLAILVCALGTHHLIPKLRAATEDKTESRGLRADFANILSNRPFIILALIIFISATCIGFTDAVGLYMFTYFWGLSSDNLAVLTLTAALGTLIAFACVPWLSRKYDKKPVGMGAVAIVMLLYPAMIVLKIFEVLPVDNAPLIFALLCTNAVVTVAAAVALTTVFISMIADATDKNELMTGQRQEAIYASAYTFSYKATSGLGGFLAGIVLQLVRFPTGVDASDVPTQTLNALGGAVALAIVAFWGLALLVFTRYRLSREEHVEILTELEARRTNQQAAPLPG